MSQLILLFVRSSLSIHQMDLAYQNSRLGQGRSGFDGNFHVIIGVLIIVNRCNFSKLKKMTNFPARSRPQPLPLSVSCPNRNKCQHFETPLTMTGTRLVLFKLALIVHASSGYDYESCTGCYIDGTNSGLTVLLKF